MLMTSGRPAQREAQYIVVAPSHEPNVPAITMPTRLMSPLVCARWAAKGIINSLGSGRNVLSMNISRMMSG